MGIALSYGGEEKGIIFVYVEERGKYCDLCVYVRMWM